MGAGRRRRTARPFGSCGGEAGFGLLEVMIASGVMLTALTSMAYVITNTLYDIAGARQRQTAIALADEAVEQARALPYPALWDGVESAYLAGDPRVLGLGTVASPYVLATTGEALRHSANLPSVAPVVPNVSSRTVDGVVYAMRFYVSCFANNCGTGMLTLTAYVDWRGGRGHRASSVRATTVKYSPDATQFGGGIGQGGCLNFLSPYAGACPASLTATASVDPGRIRLTGFGNGNAITNTWNELASATSSIGRGQNATADGSGKGGGFVVAGTPVQPESFSIADDRDPNAPPGESDDDEETRASTAYSTSAGPGTISVTATIDRTESRSTIASDNDECFDPSNVRQIDLLACQRTIGEQGGALRQAFILTDLGLGTIPLSEVSAPPSPVVAYTKHKRSSTPLEPCPGTSSTGCVHASVSRSIGLVRVGGMPSLVPLPPPFSGYLFELENYSDSARVEAGIGARAPSIPPPTGTLTYWNGGGYTSISMSGSSTFSVTTPVVTSSTTTVGVVYSVSASSTITRGPTSSRSSGTTCAGVLSCILTAEAVVGSPLIATTNYTIKLAGSTLYELTLSTNLGGLRVEATHVDPP